MYFFFLWHLKAYPEGNGFKILNFESSKENVFILASETSTLSEVAMNFEKNLLFRRTLPSLLQKSSRNDKEQQYGFSVCSILACVEVVWFVAQIIS